MGMFAVESEEQRDLQPSEDKSPVMTPDVSINTSIQRETKKDIHPS